MVLINFDAHTQEENTQTFANYMPNGELYLAKNIEGTNLRKLLFGLSGEVTRAQEKIEELSNELDANITVNLIEEWESALGIPDNCFKNDVSLEQRRKQVIAKLGLMNVQTKQDFIDLAEFFGINIDILPGEQATSVFPLTFSIIFSGSVKESKFTMVVIFEDIDSPTSDFPLIFPVKFDDDPTSFLRCLFDRIKPANVHIIYRFRDEII